MKKMRTGNNFLLLFILISAMLFTGALENVYAQHENVQKGQYEPTWQSLSQYGAAPDWFRDAKFGIWAHWGPQCEPEAGDWYAREMYDEGGWKYDYHIRKYGHPSEFGFKDIIHEWKAENWNPEELMALYKKAGAKYFFTLGNHHDNFDLWNSKYQQWNAVNMGPQRDIVGEWEKTARANGLHFGISIHSAHAWTWYEIAQRSDKTGDKTGIPYDGKLTKADGKDKWWEGYDPQELYAQNHALSIESENTGKIHSQWGWANGASVPSEAYCLNFLDRNMDVINKYNPDLIYYDDTALPLWPVSDVGLKVVAHLYNRSIREHHGKNEAVVFGKILTAEQKECMVWDVERGAPDNIQSKPWQTCTCIGSWHYDRGVYDRNQYKSARQVVHILIDVISKNGNLLLSIPIRGDGTIDEKERLVVDGIAEWMNINQEAVYSTRPWKVFGEGPAAEASNPLRAQGFNEGRRQYTSQDIRFVTKERALYAHVLAWPENGKVLIKSLSSGNPLFEQDIKSVELLGIGGLLSYTRMPEGLLVHVPDNTTSDDISLTLKITY